MERLVKRAIVIAFSIAFLAGGQANADNPIGDFFKRLGNSIAHPGGTPSPQRTAKKKGHGKKSKSQGGRDETGLQDAPPAAGPSLPTPSPTPVPTPVVRSALDIPPNKRPRRDLPYGIPVPNRTGFVTSPYAPKAGYVDVRGFPSGTEVKDPYTGKIFLVP